jgi:hypothetical protein
MQPGRPMPAGANTGQAIPAGWILRLAAVLGIQALGLPRRALDVASR